jgi:nucleoside phosphorylase
MTVDRTWVERNVGPIADALATPQALSEAGADELQGLQRELIEFDSQRASFVAFNAAASATLNQFVEIKWPEGLAPVPGDAPAGESLPAADVLIVTWTADEGHALSRVLTPGHDSQTDWKHYTKNFDQIAADMVPGCPARSFRRLGTYWTAGVGDKRVTLFKSDSHMSQDGAKLPNARVWRQIIEDCRPKWVITTGTGGAIGADDEVGDVVVSRFVTFDCQRQFARLNGESFACPTAAPDARFAEAKSLFSFNAKFLPADNKRPPNIVVADAASAGVLTTDFFGFDNSDDTYKLQGKGGVVEMGDAVLGMVCRELGSDAPDYVAVRNASDPQIKSDGLSLSQQANAAGDIYKAYGRWSTVCSAIVCWAIVAAA